MLFLCTKAFSEVACIDQICPHVILRISASSLPTGGVITQLSRAQRVRRKME